MGALLTSPVNPEAVDAIPAKEPCLSAYVIPLILNIGIKWLFLIYETLSYWFGELPHLDVYSDLGVGTKGTPPAPPGSAITSIINPLASAGAGGGAAAAPIAALIS